MDSSSWWAKKLGQQKQQSSQLRSYPPTGGPQGPVTSPQGVGGRQTVLDPDRAPNEKITMGEAVGLWQGGAGNAEKTRCPSCGSKNFFSRAADGVLGMAPKPHCYECGYPTVQFGSPTGPGGLAQRGEE